MMALIRRFEERTEEQYTRARIGGYCHLAIGEEAATVGAIDALEDGDCLFASYRDHGTALAVGSPPGAVMAELFGKETGVAHGRGGSMHLLDVERRFFGGWGIVGAHLPIAAGAALALDLPRPAPRRALPVRRRRDRDRRVPRGAQPGRRLGPADRLPDHQQPVRHGHLGRAVRRPSPSCGSAAAAYRMHGERVDGNDVLAVREATARLLAEARERAPPRRCWRRSPTASAATPLPTRARSTARAEEIDELAQARPDHPLRPALHRARAARRQDEIEQVWSDVAAEVKAAIDEALAAAFPDPDTLYEHVYGDPAWREQFARMRAGAPFGERGEERSWQT